ncbi:hypothetical protein LCGC14_0401740 [marine sediment metagenome]|uniref:Helicase ATP-binding domain-containing protein n=1 Tax=marine sediment metagenome TaxID=412755 RepID=A0A0F9VIN3_9ZZZZ
MGIMQEEVTKTKLFTLSVYDERHFILHFASLDAETYNYAHGLVAGFPERRYRKSINAWIIPFTESTFDYLALKFTDEEYEVDSDARVVIDYHMRTRESLSKKEMRRWEYVFDGKVPEIKHEPRTKAYNHQTVCLDAWHGSEYFGVLMDTGVGKTWVAVNEACWSANEKVAAGGSAYKLLIACPKSLRGTWMAQLNEHLPEGYPYWVKRVRGGRVYAVQDCINFVKVKDYKLKVFICSYEQVKNMQEELIKMKFDLFVLDESTHIKNPGAKRTKGCNEVGDSCSRRAIMTGTPVANNVLDLYSQFRFLQDGCLGYDTYKGFKNRYAVVSRLESGWEQIQGYQNIEELKHRMAKCSFVVRKKDCLDLPEKQYMLHPVEMGPRQQSMYDQMAQHFLTTLEEDMSTVVGEGMVSAKIILTQYLRLSQICSGFVKTEEGDEVGIKDGDVKLQLLKELVETFDPNNKFIVWSRFTWEVNAITDLLDAMGVGWGRLKGKDSEKKRDAAIEGFNRDDLDVRVIVGDQGCGGYGLTLLGTKDHPNSDIIYLSNDFSSLKRGQSEDRGHRIGMHGTVTYHDIACEDSMDYVIAKRLQSKKEMGDLVKDYESIRRLLLGHA